MRVNFGNLTSVYYIVDGGEPQSISVYDADNLLKVNRTQNLNFLVALNLTVGMHSIRIGVLANTYYVSAPLSSNPLSSVEVQANSSVDFNVALPVPIIIAPENIIYNESSVPFAFTVDTSAASWIGYSLDGKGNITIAGNSTLTGFSNGEHNITVYANDTFGYIAASQTVNFTVALPPEMKSFPTVTVAAVSGVAAVVVIAGLMVYFKKRKR